MAKAADPEGKRTVGIITKCDAVSKGDEQPVSTSPSVNDMLLRCSLQQIISVAQNRTEKLYHGWFAVRNRSTMDIKNGMTISMRHAKEQEFFKQAPWSCLPKDRVGISSMRSFLAQLLYNHIRGEFPQLVDEIRAMVIDCRGKMDALGPARETLVQQRQFLTDIATQYQTKTTEALKGGDNPRYGPKDSRKIMALIHRANERLTNKINLQGHKYKWKSTDEDASTKGQQQKDDLGDYEMGDDGEDEASTESNDNHEDIYSWTIHIPKLPRVGTPRNHQSRRLREPLSRTSRAMAGSHRRIPRHSTSTDPAIQQANVQRSAPRRGSSPKYYGA